MNRESRLQYFPISFFSIIMGLAGLTIVVQRAETMMSYGHGVSTVILYAVAALFVSIAMLYIAKSIFFLPAVLGDFNNPISINFFPTITIGMLLLSVAFHEVSHPIAFYLWIAGTVLHFIATIVIMSMWIRQTKFEIHHFNPSWFIPIVGNMIVPIAGLQYGPPEILWFFFSVGIVFWIPFLTIFLYRIFFHHPLPEKLIPTMFILIAPPAVGFLSYVKLTGSIDTFAKILYYFAVFLFILLVAQAGKFYKIKFYLSWWAYSFPIAAVAIASALFYMEAGAAIYMIIFTGLMILLALLIAMLAVMTIRAMLRKEICKSEK